MNEGSYLNPSDIWAQCDTAIKNLEEDNRANGIIEQKIRDFMAESSLVSKSFDALKQQMSDYLMVLHAMRLANEEDIADFRYLKLLTTGQELCGSVILEQKDAAMSARKLNEENAEKYRKKMKKEKSVALRTQYTMKIAYYRKMADLNQELYHEWEKRENKYDGIEQFTCGLFEEGAAIRGAAENALNSIRGAFQGGVYVPDMNASWRGEMDRVSGKISKNEDWEKNIPEEIQKELLKMGYTQKEIDVLCLYEVSLTSNDIKNLKSTIGTQKIYRSEDAKALMYNGKVYYIYVPSKGPKYESSWKLDWEKKLEKTNFDLAAGLLGISLEDIPKEEISVNNGGYKVQETKISSKDKNVTTALGLHLLMGMESFVVSALNHTEITMVFESSGDSRRVTIEVEDSQARLRFQQMDYNMPINTYQSAGDWQVEKNACDYAQGIYQMATGESVSNKDGAYTITRTVDEGHRECAISGYLSYAENKDLLYKPLILPGDTAHVAECMKHTGYFPNEILEVTDLLSNPVIADEEVRKIFEQALEGK